MTSRYLPPDITHSTTTKNFQKNHFRLLEVLEATVLENEALKTEIYNIHTRAIETIKEENKKQKLYNIDKQILLEKHNTSLSKEINEKGDLQQKLDILKENLRMHETKFFTKQNEWHANTKTLSDEISDLRKKLCNKDKNIEKLLEKVKKDKKKHKEKNCLLCEKKSQKFLLLKESNATLELEMSNLLVQYNSVVDIKNELDFELKETLEKFKKTEKELKILQIEKQKFEKEVKRLRLEKQNCTSNSESSKNNATLSSIPPPPKFQKHNNYKGTITGARIKESQILGELASLKNENFHLKQKKGYFGIRHLRETKMTMNPFAEQESMYTSKISLNSMTTKSKRKHERYSDKNVTNIVGSKILDELLQR